MTEREIRAENVGKDVEDVLLDALPRLETQEVFEGLFTSLGYALACVNELASRGECEDEGPWAWQREDGLTVTYTLNAINEIAFLMQCPADEIVARMSAQEDGQ